MTYGMAGILKVTPMTLRNWRKEKPKLYEIVMKGFAFDEIVEQSKASYEKAKEIKEKFEVKK
ncbi:MAG: hypothetical protein WC141_07685 [Arcobacteraceae bacterium]